MALNLHKKEISASSGEKVDLTEEVYSKMGPSVKIVAILCDALKIRVQPTKGKLPNGNDNFYFSSADAEEVRKELIRALRLD